MKYFIANDFLTAGYLIRNLNWKRNECLALSCGGDVSLKEFSYKALGVSEQADKILTSINKSEIFTIEPHIIKFNGPMNICHEYVLTTKEQLIDEWGIFDGHITDILNWVEGTRLCDELGTVLNVKKSLPDGEVLTESLNGDGYAWYPIFFLYEKGFRVKVDKSNWN